MNELIVGNVKSIRAGGYGESGMVRRIVSRLLEDDDMRSRMDKFTSPDIVVQLDGSGKIISAAGQTPAGKKAAMQVLGMSIDAAQSQFTNLTVEVKDNEYWGEAKRIRRSALSEDDAGFKRSDEDEKKKKSVGSKVTGFLDKWLSVGEARVSEAGDDDEKRYRVFTRTWWKEEPGWPGGLEPEMGEKNYGHPDDLTWEEARDYCTKWNSEHEPGRLSLKAEFEEQ